MQTVWVFQHITLKEVYFEFQLRKLLAPRFKKRANSPFIFHLAMILFGISLLIKSSVPCILFCFGEEGD
jgi:hypothetical protein